MDKTEHIKEIIVQALFEDVGEGDVTTLSTIPKTQILSGNFLAKTSGVMSGLNVVEQVFSLIDKNIRFEIYMNNGTIIEKGNVLARISGPGISILKGERVSLNFLQRMSGIATVTKQYVDIVKGTKAVILDTRKTVPGLRVLDKQAVKDGGGQNHRFGLFDMYLIKDNHIAAAGSVTKAIQCVRTSNTKGLLIEVEVNTLKQLQEALIQKPDRIMLDNMNLDEIKRAVKQVAGQVPIEVSGGVNLQTVLEIAQTGVEYISVGALTHSVKALDISLEIV